MKGKRKRRHTKPDPTPIELQPSDYQPSKTELEAAETIRLPVTPLQLARAVVRDVEITHPAD